MHRWDKGHKQMAMHWSEYDRDQMATSHLKTIRRMGAGTLKALAI